ncbi:hypothetical protein L3Q82_004042 [Scortum barcoo]|uniref:Uncharacterized protein n=1 Tax=Scortum barcoo TaxID=214431 RepID=A0ACB8X7N5_9TELE|nr:hypothetical protein L3Q82_004042 [Scortum barcoo]
MGAADSTFRLNILGASLFVKKTTVSPAVRLGHAAGPAESQRPLPPLTRHGQNLLHPRQFQFQDLQPGARITSPFNFIHNDVEYLALCQDGRQVPAKAFQPQFGQGISVREFYNMFITTGRHLKDLPLSINL